ncbi:MAG: GH92 family glycosyl hydrolase [Bacteroidaceae bacterium]|nr:GH92 family glycosyl hydrolase [Bacteroidaceae bacterium]
MKVFRKTIVLLAIMLSASAVGFAKGGADLTKYVDPMIGTAFTGHTFPGATYPFGMIQLSPDNGLEGWEVCSGYHYDEPSIYGFSHTHLNGTGCADLCDILFMPVADYSAKSINGDDYRSEYSHGGKDEIAKAGYYSVNLKRWGVNAELTTGRRAAMHHYVYTNKAAADNEVIIDLTHREELIDGYLKKVDDHTISGLRRSRFWAGDQSVYFYAEFSEPFVEVTTEEARVRASRSETFSRPLKALLHFGKKKSVYVRVGISSVSEENARLNLRSELANEPGEKNFKKQFSKTYAGAKAAWNQFLNKIEVKAEDRVRGTDGTVFKAKEQLTSFYTALYHTAIAPCLFSDVNGEYRGMDGKVHVSKEHEQYTVFSLWDTYRALHPLFSIIEQERTKDFLYSFLCIYRECGKLPIWELHRNETNCMIGYHSISVIADAWMKGITLSDKEMEELFLAMLESTRKEEFGIDIFHKEGFVNPDKEHESVSKTLEYCYDDWCIATVADKLGYKEIAAEFYKSALYYRNIFDPSTGFMRPKVRGIWLTPFDPTEVNSHFTEANSWQYSFHVQHNIKDHIALLGGDKAYGDKLDALFSAPSETTGREQSDITGLIGQYAHGNEPSHHDAYLFDAAGRPWRTAEVVHQVTDLFYQPVPDGLCGNDDCGQMSAWYIFSTLGFYPVCPGKTSYAVGSPHFKQATIHLEDGTTTTIKSNTRDGIYVQRLDVPGSTNALRSYINHSELLNGGVITFTLGSKPSADYGVEEDNRYITSSPSEFAAPTSPWFTATNTMIKDGSAVVTVEKGQPDGLLFYRVRSLYDNSDTIPYVPYSTPISVDKRCCIDAFYYEPSGRLSFPVTTRIDRVDKNLSITLGERFHRNYTAGGSEALIDGFRGTTNWRTGGWQGYVGTDLHATVDLGFAQPLSRVGAGFLQDVGSWIWMPRDVEFLVSEDGKQFQSLGTVSHNVDPADTEIQCHDLFVTPASPVQARYLQMVVHTFGTIPEWHVGAGTPAFFFVDEMLWE